MGNCLCNCCRFNPSTRSLNRTPDGIGQESVDDTCIVSLRDSVQQQSGDLYHIAPSGQVFANYIDASPTLNFVEDSCMRTCSAFKELPECRRLSQSQSSPLTHWSRSVRHRPLKLAEVSTDDVWKPSGAPYSSASFFITNKATTIEWKGHGLKIHIPENSLPPSLSFTPVQLEIHAHTFMNDVTKWYHDPMGIILLYPDMYMPISTLYSIQMGAGKLCKPVTFEFQHCCGAFSNDFDTSDLVILRAPNASKHFKPIEDAVFDRGTGYGKITVPKLNCINQEYNDFSWFMVALRRLFFPRTICYKAHVYTSKITMKMYFIVTMALELCTTVRRLIVSPNWDPVRPCTQLQPVFNVFLIIA